MIGWNNTKLNVPGLDYNPIDNNQPTQPICDTYNPFERNSSYAVAAVAKEETHVSCPSVCDLPKKKIILDPTK